jgi:hypothetical protein
VTVDPAEVEALAAQLLAEAREELVRADSKAAMLLAAFGVVVGVVVAGLVAGDFRPNDLGCVWEVIWWCGCVVLAAALVALARAIYPALTHPEADGSISYFGHAAAKSDATALQKALEVQVAGARSRTVEQLKVISDLAWFKYRCLQVALFAFGAGSGLCILAVVAS